MDKAYELYNKGLDEKHRGNFDKWAEYHLRAIKLMPDWEFPEAWHNAGAALQRIGRGAESGKYLKKALVQYDYKLNLGYKRAYHLFWKACVYALMNKLELALPLLKECILLDITYAEEVLKEEDFANFVHNELLLDFLEPYLAIIKKNRFKGELLWQEELTDLQVDARNIFIETLKSLAWEEDLTTETFFEMGKSISPQAKMLWLKNAEFIISWTIYLDATLLCLDLENRASRHDHKLIRLYLNKELNFSAQIIPILEEFNRHIAILNKTNWADLIRSLTKYCHQIGFELPDGKLVVL